MKKEYLGDSVYAKFEGGFLILTTENGGPASNTILLDESVYSALLEFVARLRDERDDDEKP